MSSEVEAFIQELEHSRKEEVADLYRKISSSFPELKSEIKWNAPSFVFNGMNMLTFRLFPDPAFQIILHVGVKKLAQPPDLQFELTNFKHKWADKTRCVIKVPRDIDWQELNKIICTWLRTVPLCD